MLPQAYGLEPAGPQITSDFAQILEQKLAQLTQLELATALVRQRDLRLTTADIEVFGLSTGKPAATRTVGIPAALWTDAPALLSAVRSHLLQVRRRCRGTAWVGQVVLLTRKRH